MHVGLIVKENFQAERSDDRKIDRIVDKMI